MYRVEFAEQLGVWWDGFYYLPCRGKWIGRSSDEFVQCREVCYEPYPFTVGFWHEERRATPRSGFVDRSYYLAVYKIGYGFL